MAARTRPYYLKLDFGDKAMNTPAFARVGTFAVAVAALAMFDAIPGIAAEKVYDPQVGSRWIVETETRGEEVRPDGTATSVAKTRAELTHEQKTADGFRISYLHRAATVEGNARSVPLRRAYMKVMENVVIRASTDLAGKPLRIDNLDEARDRMGAGADAIVGQFYQRPA